MKRHFLLFIHYFAQYSKVRMAYKGDFFIALGTSFTATLLGFGFVLVLFSKIPNLKGWSFNELLFLYGFSLIPLGFFNMLSLNLYQFGEVYIIQGKFDRILLRPIHSLFQVLFEAFRLESLQETITGILVMAYCSHRMHLEWGTIDVLLAVVMIALGAIIYLATFLILTSVSFFFEDKVGVVPPVYNMLAFGRYPLSIYNVFIQFLLSWIIPFAFASFYPSVRLLHRSEYGGFYVLLPAVALFFSGLALVLWQLGERNYSSTGT
ncbi:MAG: ABC-2 family transporter protein [Acidobacteriia bacterium]|nr:ABC-2 family transporter protein [Terriglobia bacterium]